MKGTMRVASTLAVVFCFVLVESAISGKPVQPDKGDPIWKIFQDGTAQPVPWVDAENPRFAVYDGMVLDKETGLVWEQEPFGDPMNWASAVGHCYEREVANRMGWRIPTVEELAGLVDNDNASPALPSGHPFGSVQINYWTANTHASLPTTARMVTFDNGAVSQTHMSYATNYVWCVRGGRGFQALPY